MKRLLLALLLLLLIGGGYLYYRHTRTGPEYSLLQAYRAATAHDAATFEQYVDVGSVASHLLDDVASQGQIPGLPAAGLLGGALQLFKPQLTQAARQEVRQYIETGTLPARRGPGSAVSVLGLAGGLVANGGRFQGISYSRQDGEQARVGLKFTQPRYDTTLVLEVTMQRRADYWQATEISNAGVLLQQVAQLEKQRLMGR